MSQTKWVNRSILAMFLFTVTAAQAGDGLRVSAAGAYSATIGGLTGWFRSGNDLQLGLGRDNGNGWFLEGMLEYTQFNKDNLSGYAKGRVGLSLEHIAFWANGKYTLWRKGPAATYFTVGGGPVYWKGIRGAIPADEELAIPFIPRKVLDEWNMGFRTGLGAEYSMGSFGLDGSLCYRFVVGSLWPTMQESIEIEAVSGFQSLSIRIGVFYQF